jgi:tetratricopeptide (TPR) repeat protein
MQRRNDIYNQESARLPFRRNGRKAGHARVEQDLSAGGRAESVASTGLYAERERRASLQDDLGLRRPSARTKSARSRRGRRDSRRMSASSKWMLVFLTLILTSYMAFIGWRLFAGRQVPAPVAEPVATEVVADEVLVPVEEGPSEAELVAAEAERIEESLRVSKRALSLLGRAESAQQRGPSTQAKTYLLDALAESPNLVEALMPLGALYLEERDYTAARDIYLRVLDIDPLREGVRLKLAESLLALRQFQSALDLALWVLEDDTYLEEPNRIAALAYMGLNRIEQAVVHFRRQVAINRDNVMAQNNLAVAYARLGQYDRATRLFEAVMEAEPGNAITYYNLAAAYAQRNDFTRTVQTLTQAADRFEASFVAAWLRHRDFDPVREDPAFEALELRLEEAAQ